STSYQRRAFDAVRYYNDGFASSIIISSGSKQTFQEVLIIRALLTNQGVPEQDIFVLDQYPSSTYETVVLLKQKLDAAGAESILFMTSPYHSQRALWIWQKQAPDLIVIAPTVVDTPPVEPQWSTTIDQIKVIGYECMAILYNWYKGWL
ncbi:MAG TPA: YdcF family protein, partial [Sulfurimonas sp.]|nr:YdcF family protein [Sulfurimonas sp.]